MRFSLIVVSLLWSMHTFGQLVERPIVKGQKHRLDKITEEQSRLNLPFWDDFSKTTLSPGTLWEFSGAVTVSTGLSINPPSYNAATLDGLDENGNIYDGDDDFPGLTDQLISRRIDLSGSLVNDESIYLSFFWEAGGNMERPEDKSDSLRLQFLNSDSVWVTQWKESALDLITLEQFRQEIVKVETGYRHADFRFKFETFGSQKGSFDAWHIDYVILNNGRSPNNLTYLDRAFSGSISAMTAPYREMPATHFFDDPSKYLVNQRVIGANQDDEIHTFTLNYKLEDVISGQTYEFSDGSNSFQAGLIQEVTLDDTPNIPANPSAADSVVFNVEVNSNFNDDSTPYDFGVNDTIRDTYLFHNYYAYDDGTAETSAGVEQNGSVSIMYVLGQKDTLTHVDIYFPSTTPTPAGKTLNVNVWLPSYQQDIDSLRVTKKITVPDQVLNSFMRVDLSSNIVVEDTVYIGYKQNTTEFLAIGLDRSNQAAKSKMHYLSVGKWVQNENANGIMMIRPVFKQAGSNVILDVDIDADALIYPNPTNGFIQIDESYHRLVIWTLSGQLLMEEKSKAQHDLSQLKAGVYLLELVNKGSSKMVRLVKE